MEWVRLGDVTEMVRAPIELASGESYRRIGIYSWAKGFLHRPAADAEEMGSMRYFTFPEKALVVSNIQAWEGAVAVSGEAERGYVCSNRFLPYVPSPDLNVRYLFHYLASNVGLDLLRKASPGTTVRNRTLSRVAFENSKIPLPDLPTQRRIAARLDAIAEQRPAALARDGLRAIRESLIRRATADAPSERVSDVLCLQRRAVSVNPDEVYREIGVRSFGRGLFIKEPITGAELGNKRVFQIEPSDLVVSNIFAWEGAVALASKAHAGMIGSHRFMTWTTRGEDLLPDYALAYFTSARGVDQLRNASPGSAGRNRTLGIKSFEQLMFPVPSIEVQLDLIRKMGILAELAFLGERRDRLSDALLPAARNEEFTRLISS
ncbi:restriction endonuclease subunit S [Myceligenerans halotolerans]